jgi:hypothetical protein
MLAVPGILAPFASPDTRADANRKASLKGIPTQRGFDRDEYPPAMSDQGGGGERGRASAASSSGAPERRKADGRRIAAVLRHGL